MSGLSKVLIWCSEMSGIIYKGRSRNGISAYEKEECTKDVVEATIAHMDITKTYEISCTAGTLRWEPSDTTK